MGHPLGKRVESQKNAYPKKKLEYEMQVGGKGNVFVDEPTPGSEYFVCISGSHGDVYWI